MLMLRKLFSRYKNSSAIHPSKNKLIYENIIRDLPGIIYWKDISGHYLGCNQYAVDLMQKTGVTKTNNLSEIIGKTDFDLFDKKTAEQYQENDRLVIKNKKAITPEHFLTVAEQYPKDTKICLDQNFNHSRMDGLYLAEQLNKLGYTKLFLISGEEFDKRKLPKYLKVLKKSHIEEVKNY